MVYVTKFDGRREKFTKGKILRTCMRVGVPRSVALNIVSEIENRAYDGISTKEIYRMLLKRLEAYKKKTASVFALRESVSNLEPHIFELFVRKLLEAHGFACKNNIIVQGKCIDHEVDVLARNDDITYLVECKRHHNGHRFTGLSVCLQVQARLEDVIDGCKIGKNSCEFDTAWIITNTKFSEHAQKYAKAKGLRLTGWYYPDNQSFEKMVESKNSYPVNVLSARRDVLQRMFDSGIITINDMNYERLLKVLKDEKTVKNLMKQKEQIIINNSV